MTDIDIKEIKEEAEEIFKDIRGGNWEKFVRLQLEGAVKKQVGRNPFNRRTVLLESTVTDVLVIKGFIKERAETEQTIYIVTTSDFSSLINDGGYLEKPDHKEYGFSSEVDTWAYYLDQEKIRKELGLDCSELKVYKENRII